jgi:TonB family protein
MRRCLVVCSILIISLPALSRGKRSAPAPPDRFEIGRLTFFDFGPPFDFYELLLVRPAANGTSIERITLTPAGDACTQPATIETASASISEPVAVLFGSTNPCAIPEKELRRELKRCKKCLVFSGADVAMQVQCGNQTRIIRSDILDKDMFDPAANTPEHTSWTMQLLARLDHAVGPGVMERPIFLVGDKAEPSIGSESEVLRDVGLGKYDGLFQRTTVKPSDVYRAAQNRPPPPSVRLASSSPAQPDLVVLPKYPPLARQAHIEGSVTFTVEVGPDGSPASFTLLKGHPVLSGAVKEAVSGWKFPKETTPQLIQATIEFGLNCSAQGH